MQILDLSYPFLEIMRSNVNMVKLAWSQNGGLEVRASGGINDGAAKE